MVQGTITIKEIHKATNLKKKSVPLSAKIIIQFRYESAHKKQYLNSISSLFKRQSLLPSIKSEVGYFQILLIAYLDKFFHALV